MLLRRLEVDGVRNLRGVKLENLARINIISGPNGSGKTSLLEAIFLLGMGRSFRSSRIAPLINNKSERALVYGEVDVGDGTTRSLGLLKTRSGEQQMRVNRQAVSSLADLARELPLQLLDADSFSLIDGGPKARRQFMDWGVFHVKPRFMSVWRLAQRALRQRNELLRRGGHSESELVPWEHELDKAAEELDALRSSYISGLGPSLAGMLGHFSEVPDLEVVYRRGWKHGSSLLDEMATSRRRDRELGYTQAGPHRATLELRVAGQPAAEVLSRGQQKLVVACLKLAQAARLADEAGIRGVFLVDDLPAELDRQHRRILCGLLDQLGMQVFMTCVDADMLAGPPFEGVWSGKGEVMRFHVEQGDYKCLKS